MEPTSNVSELTVSVVANEPVTKDIITAGFLDDKSEIGVAMYNDDLGFESGVSYHYHNVKFTAAGTAENQVWTPEQPIFLGETVGTAYAYYPYNDEVTNVEEIPVTTVGQTDYLYAKQENLSNTATNATFPMNHGLAVISMKVVRGSYPGAGSLTKAEVRGPGICTAGKLNAKTGELHSFKGKAEPVVVNTAFTIDTEGDVVDVIVVPNGETGSFHITFTIDGVEYTTTTTEIKLEAGCRYHYTVTANERQMVLSAVTIGDWVYNDAGDRMIMVGGYSITLAGDLAGLAFNSVVNESTVTIEARSKTAFWVPVSITASEGVTMTQDLATDGLITLNLSEFTADVVVTFVGYKVEIVQSYTDCVISDPSINAEKVITFTAAPINCFWVPNISKIGSGDLAQEIASDGKVSVSLKNVSSDIKVSIDGYYIAYTSNFSKYVLQEEINSSKHVTITGAIDPTVADGSSFIARSVSMNGTAEMSFDLSSGLTIELSNISSPVILILDGYTITVKSNVSATNIKTTGYFDALAWLVTSPYELGTLEYWLPYASHTGSSSSLTTNTISDSQFTVLLDDINEDETVTLNACKVSATGNMSNIEVTGSKEDQIITYVATPNSTAGNTAIKNVNRSGNFSMTRTVTGGSVLQYKLYNISSNATLTFNGVATPPEPLADNWDGLEDGVYAVSHDLKPVSISSANETCIGVALINSTTGQKFMIEKYEDFNSTYQQVSANHGTDSEMFAWGYCNSTMNVILGISDYTTYTYIKDTYKTGYVPDKNGSYYLSFGGNRLGLPTTWPTDATQYALADYEGLKHSNYLKQVTQTDSYNLYPTMASLLKSFLESNDGYGFDDWYIPACGQLALFYVYKSDINSALSAIGGRILDGYYWSSSERGSSSGWYLIMESGAIEYYAKYKGRRVRFIRDL